LQDILEYRKRLERGYSAEDEAFKWLKKKCDNMSGNLQILFAEHNDDGYDIVIIGRIPGKKKLKCCIEVKGVSKYSEPAFIYISKNEYLTMQRSLDESSQYDYVALVVDEVLAAGDPTQKKGKVCGYSDAKSLSNLDGWATAEATVDHDVDPTEFRLGIQTLKEKDIFFEPDMLFVRTLYWI
jgi:hypothetical protein